MKKILKILIFLIAILGITGCDKDQSIVPNEIDAFESDIDYFIFRNKKIYLTKNLEQYVMQFQGFGCKLNRNLEIDNINSKEHGFYQMKEEDFDISCPSVEIRYPADFSVMINFTSEEQRNDIKSVDKDIYYWRISGGISEEIGVYFNNEKIIVDGENASDKNEVISILGTDYEYENSIFNRNYYDLIYKRNSIKYSFSFNEDDELFSISVVE